MNRLRKFCVTLDCDVYDLSILDMKSNEKC